VIVVDCHEHAYIKDFNTNLSNYLEKMMSELNWDVINDRVVKTDMFSEGLK
jgi:superoxide dismutase